ncbi:head completion/stabilization protein, partial [Salmonella enterica]|nr:head completion/stabilization protein [Salmonella enterica]EBI0860662.1 head completion/stabilization protein [Salmonella enterica]EBP6934195.1 head completion/stabilization protein [Salmonella enterica subsp. enterica]EBR5287268.1 head completion/stabilization protein [Salmonella enterica]EBU6117172.1 head completion/stabilization protein [Salmonella enterica]
METGQSAFFGGFMFSGKPLDYQDEPLANNGFWPDLNLKDFQVQRSLPPDIDADTISQALLAAVAEVNAELENVEASWKAKGHTLAADVPGVKMGGLNSLCAQYMKAV